MLCCCGATLAIGTTVDAVLFPFVAVAVAIFTFLRTLCDRFVATDIDDVATDTGNVATDTADVAAGAVRITDVLFSEFCCRKNDKPPLIE